MRQTLKSHANGTLLAALALACKAGAPDAEAARAAQPDARPPVASAQAVGPSPASVASAEPSVYRSPSQLMAPAPAPGRWRLATLHQLEQAMIWPAHILVRHREVVPGLASFALPLWRPAPPAPLRTRRAALELAQQLAEQLRTEPARFAELARRHSEDIVTRNRGGALGGVSASVLTDWPEVLDSLQALKPGAASSVVETGYGFHIFMLRPPPEERRLAGARIVIGYDEAPWLHRFLARKPIPARSRRAAEALAHEVYERARRAPADFARFVSEYSEHRDAERGGDFGEWSTREPSPFPDALEVLQQLEPGEVAAPVDSLFGFQVIQRTPERRRTRYGVAAVQQHYDPTAASGPNVRSSVLRTMTDALRVLHADASRFAELQLTLCCTGLQSFNEGQGPAPVEKVALGLAVGGIAPELVEYNDRFAIVRRVEPAPGSTVIRTGVPEPARPDLDDYFKSAGHTRVLRDFGEVAGELPGLAAEERRRVRELHALPPAAAASGQQPLSHFRRLQVDVSHLLGAERYAEYRLALERRVERELLSPAPGVSTFMMQ